MSNSQSVHNKIQKWRQPEGFKMGRLPDFWNRNNIGNKNDVQGNSIRGFWVGEEPRDHLGLLDNLKTVGELVTEKWCRGFPLKIENLGNCLGKPCKSHH